MSAVPTPTDAVKTAWDDQSRWSLTANQLKASLTFWRNLAELAGVAGAILATLSATLPHDGPRFRWLRIGSAIAAAVVLALVPFILKFAASKDQVSNWVRARSAAEALKENVFRYLTGAPPYGPAKAPAELIRRCQLVQKNVEDLWIYAARTDPAAKPVPPITSADDYLVERVNKQIEEYYLPKGATNARFAERYQKIEIGLGAVAVVLGAILSASVAQDLPQLAVAGPWVAVITTAGAAVTAHLAASRFVRQAITYYGTASRLRSLRDEWLATPNRTAPECVSKFVDDCEHAISTENEAWLTEWQRELPKKS
ncbi:MAG TPA: DUF4231 domain-containing protein [Planctomycetaceae bacterium]|jgi:hypothetical protein|nr:DUF4231 domain-containing protein [Planctomycetaceae bacterium]